MTEENFRYRTSQTMLRNEYDAGGKWHMPGIPKAQFREEEFEGLRLLGFDRARAEDIAHQHRMVHFFLYDYKFERVWKEPDRDIDRISGYRAVLSPDFSIYREMHPLMQLFNVFRNRWCGAHFAKRGLRVIPTVSWGDEESFAFCFSGIPKGSTVAVSTYMVSEHGNHQDQKAFFLLGYRELLRRVEPERILCYHTPFPEMQGNIVPIDYDLSSWRHMEDDANQPSPFAKYVLGLETPPQGSGIVIKRCGYTMRWDEADDSQRSGLKKGMGSAYGGTWRPKKEEDQRLWGTPGEIKVMNKSNGEVYITKIGEDGRAVKERHLTDHGNPVLHSVPHDHIIGWNAEIGYPIFVKPHICYWPEEYPNGAPDFKNYRNGGIQKDMNQLKSDENNFESIGEFKMSLEYGGEIGFSYGGKNYTITSPDEHIISIGEMGWEGVKTIYETCEELLEYRIAGERLKDIITKMEVLWRNV